MPITSRNILAHEWIGLEITIKQSPDPKLNGLSGLVRDETRNTLVVETQGRTRKTQHSIHRQAADRRNHDGWRKYAKAPARRQNKEGAEQMVVRNIGLDVK